MNRLAKFRVIVCWMDGHEDTFDCIEVESSDTLVELYVADGWYRHIPLMSIRWYDTCTLPTSMECEPQKDDTEHHTTSSLEFPCTYIHSSWLNTQPRMATLEDCESCRYSETCDIYATMLNEDRD